MFYFERIIVPIAFSWGF